MKSLTKTTAQFALIMGITGIYLSETNAKSMVTTYECPNSEEVKGYLNHLSNENELSSKANILHSDSTKSDWVLDESSPLVKGSQFKDINLKAEITPDICTYTATTDGQKKVKVILRDAYLSPKDKPSLENVPIFNPIPLTDEEDKVTYEPRD